MWLTQILIAFLWTRRNKKTRPLHNRNTLWLHVLVSNKEQDCNYLQHGELIIGGKHLGRVMEGELMGRVQQELWRRVTKLGLILAIALPRPSWYIEMLASLCGPHGSTSTRLLLKWHASASYQCPRSTVFWKMVWHTVHEDRWVTRGGKLRNVLR